MRQIYATEFQYSQGWMKMMYDEREQYLQEYFAPAKPQRLNPAAIYFNLIKFIKETIFGLGAGFIFTIKQSLFYSLMFLLIFLVVTIVTRSEERRVGKDCRFWWSMESCQENGENK